MPQDTNERVIKELRAVDSVLTLYVVLCDC